MPIDNHAPQLIDTASDYQIKFVVDSPDDYEELLEIVDSA